ASALALQPQTGKILVAGQLTSAAGPDFCLARYTADGKLDTASFGFSGKITTDFNGGQDYGRALVVQPDGKNVLVGNSNKQKDLVVMARYTIDGLPDLNFGTQGKVTIDFPGAKDYGADVALQADGKIVVAAVTVDVGTDPGDFALARFDGAGKPDPTFGT